MFIEGGPVDSFRSTHTMKRSELNDTCYHEAAHAVIAVLVGAFVNHVEIGTRPFMGMQAGGGCSWVRTGDLDWEDVYAIYAAGFVSDIRRGVPPAVADLQSEGDRIDMRKALEEIEGTFLSEKGREIRFRQGVARVETLLDRPEVANAWQVLGAELVTRVSTGTTRMPGPEVMRFVRNLLGG
jgi:hypothetical protein